MKRVKNKDKTIKRTIPSSMCHCYVVVAAVERPRSRVAGCRIKKFSQQIQMQRETEKWKWTKVSDTLRWLIVVLLAVRLLAVLWLTIALWRRRGRVVVAGRRGWRGAVAWLGCGICGHVCGKRFGRRFRRGRMWESRVVGKRGGTRAGRVYE